MVLLLLILLILGDDREVAPADIKCVDCGCGPVVVYISYHSTFEDKAPYWYDACGFLHVHDASHDTTGYECEYKHSWTVREAPPAALCGWPNACKPAQCP